MTASDFEAEVARAFAFLVDRGFVRDPAESARGESWVVFRSPASEVSVHREGGVWVTLRDPHVPPDKPWWWRNEYNLHALLQELGVPAAESELQAQADALRTHGAAVLAGDFSVLHARQRRLGEAVERNR